MTDKTLENNPKTGEHFDMTLGYHLHSCVFCLPLPMKLSGNSEAVNLTSSNSTSISLTFLVTALGSARSMSWDCRRGVPTGGRGAGGLGPRFPYHRSGLISHSPA